ncbi:hypothetical protein [Microseira wollei]|uniref:hypothetical protein n=1 Tax=Microseira wollei TaxID=467598 RepID=UPI001CFD317C|nr:hypothetical protein [Microseira wollei]
MHQEKWIGTYAQVPGFYEKSLVWEPEICLPSALAFDGRNRVSFLVVRKSWLRNSLVRTYAQVPGFYGNRVSGLVVRKSCW